MPYKPMITIGNFDAAEVKVVPPRRASHSKHTIAVVGINEDMTKFTMKKEKSTTSLRSSKMSHKTGDLNEYQI